MMSTIEEDQEDDRFTTCCWAIRRHSSACFVLSWSCNAWAKDVLGKLDKDSFTPHRVPAILRVPQRCKQTSTKQDPLNSQDWVEKWWSQSVIINQLNVSQQNIKGTDYPNIRQPYIHQPNINQPNISWYGRTCWAGVRVQPGLGWGTLVGATEEATEAESSSVRT